jgi:hypothetical protein
MSDRQKIDSGEPELDEQQQHSNALNSLDPAGLFDEGARQMLPESLVSGLLVPKMHQIRSLVSIMIEIRLIIQLGKFSALCLLQKISAGLQLMGARTRGISTILNQNNGSDSFHLNASFYPSRSFSTLYPS